MSTPSGAHPTPAQFAGVMANVATLRIPGEFGSNLGELVRLDTVSLAPPCPGDADGNGVINFVDLDAVLSAYGQSAAPGFTGADVNNDGVVNFVDLNAVLSGFGAECE